jgi:integrase
MPTAKQQLDLFLDKYTPAVVSQARRALAKMRKLTPGSLELVYDNYAGLVIGFAPNEKPSSAIFSLLLLADHITLCFLHGKGLPDPAKRLKGSGNLVRHIRLDSPSTIDEPEVQSLIAAAKRRARVPLDPKQKRQLIIRSISAKQRARRPRA